MEIDEKWLAPGIKSLNYENIVKEYANMDIPRFDLLMTKLEQFRLLLKDDKNQPISYEISRYNALRKNSSLKRDCTYAQMSAAVFLKRGLYKKMLEQIRDLVNLIDDKRPLTDEEQKEIEEGRPDEDAEE